jgi:hypothetical protein
MTKYMKAVHMLYANTMSFLGLEHLWSLVSIVGRGTNHPQIPREDYSLFSVHEVNAKHFSVEN